MTRRRSVVVTGLGVVSGFGVGVESFWAGLRAGRRAIREVRRFDVERHRTRLASEVPDPPAPQGRRLSLSDRFAIAAVDEAIAGAGVPAGRRHVDTAVFFGSSTGGMWESEGFYAELKREGASRPRLGDLVAQQYNGPGDAVARHVGATGPVESVSSACTSGALAIGAAVEAIRDDEVDVALAGGSDSLCELTFAGFNSLRAVDAAPCRPFRADRAGLNLGEGAAVLVLESREHAEARGARPLAAIPGWASTCDAHHMTAPEPFGRGATAAIKLALRDAAVDPASIGFVNAHGTGTPLNDAAEWRAIEAVFGSSAATLPVTANKSSVGHLLGAAGAIESVATVLGLLHGEVPPTADGEGALEPPAVALVRGAPQPLDASHAISVNLAFGGSNAAVVFAAERSS